MKKRTKIDARGAQCPGPLMELIAGLRNLGKGDEVEILSNDKGSLTDIPIWAKKAGHAIEKIEEIQDHYSIVVEKVKT